MRVAELSRVTGVPIPTIKYYIRSGLLPAGNRTSRNQARYDESHVRRLRLIRALIEVGGLSVAATRGVLDSLGSPELTLFGMLGKAQYAMPGRDERTDAEPAQSAIAAVDALLERHGWRVKPGNPARRTLAHVLSTLDQLGQQNVDALLSAYADAAERLATTEVATLRGQDQVDSMVETLVIWTVLGDTLLSALRRLAQESAAARALEPG